MMKQPSDFDVAATEWDQNVERRQFLDRILVALFSRMEVLPDMTLIDYGCGTGNTALPVAEKARHVYGVDTSQGMLSELHKKLGDQGIDNVTPLCLDLSRTGFVFSAVDAVFSVLTLHHVPDIDPLLGNLAAAIKPGGRIFLIDLYAEDGNFHRDDELVPHLGFDPDALCAKLQALGFENCRHDLAAIRKRKDNEYPVFIISADKRH